MKWIDRAEVKFGHLAIPGLLRIVAGFNALCFVLIKLNPHFFEFLYLDRGLVMQGEVWRLLTYIFIPSMGGFFPDWLAAFFYLSYLVWIGEGLEHAMGAFRLTLFYVFGMLGTTVACFLVNADPTGFLLNASLLFAFAYQFPKEYLFYILPVPWVAWASGALLLLDFFRGTWPFRAALFVALANFFVFFGRQILDDARHRQNVTKRRRRFESAAAAEGDALHRCEVCGRTELVAPEMDFRVAKDGHEYCAEHLPKATPSAQT